VEPAPTTFGPRTIYTLRFADGRPWTLGERTHVMGILNITPDSFSDGGRTGGVDRTVETARRMVDAGADVVDVGGESTRPGAEPVSAEEEKRRVLPAVEAIKKAVDVRVSVDTVKASVAAGAIEAGADVINDVSALSDPEMDSVVARSGVPVVLMHMRGTPRTMQRDTGYDDLMSEIADFLRDAAEKAIAAGVSDDKILVDPGIGFGKSPVGNLQILRELSTLRRVDRPLLVGASRKSFIGSVLGLPVADRLEGSLAAAGVAAWQGAHVVRVHDVAETVRVVRMVDAIRGS
jgi:dihydropteroate synthase